MSDTIPIPLRERRLTRTEEEIRNAVNNACTCGGLGPNDPDACPACMVWHELKAVRR